MCKLITVIVPVYNVEQYLEHSIQSICNQTYTQLEIILVNDGSTDQSGDICNKLANKDTRIRVFNQKNQGVSVARNKGLDEASGDYIMFMDADDWLDADAIQTLYNLITEKNAHVSCCSLREVYEDKDNTEEAQDMQTIEVAHNKADAGLLLLKTWAIFCKLYRKELLQKIRFKGYRIAEDLLFNTDVICETEFCSAVFTDKKMYNYRIRPNSAMQQGFHKKYMESMQVEAKCYKRLIGLSPEYGKIELISCGVRLFFEKYAKLSRAEKRKNKAYFKECRQYMKEHKKAFLGNYSGKRKLLGLFKLSMPRIYMFLLSIRYKR